MEVSSRVGERRREGRVSEVPEKEDDSINRNSAQSGLFHTRYLITSQS